MKKILLFKVILVMTTPVFASSSLRPTDLFPSVRQVETGAEKQQGKGSQDFPVVKVELEPAYQYYLNNLYLEEMKKGVKQWEKRSNAIDAFLKRAEAYLQKGEFDLALVEVAKAMKIDPDYTGNHFVRASIYQRQGKYKQAIADFDKELKGFDQDGYLEAEDKLLLSMIYNGRGYAYISLGQYQQALADLNKALQFDPKFTEAYGSRGLAHGKLGRYEQALSDHGRAIKLRPDLAELYYERAQTYQTMNQNTQAIADYKKYLELAGPQDNAAFMEDARRKLAALGG